MKYFDTFVGMFIVPTSDTSEEGVCTSVVVSPLYSYFSEGRNQHAGQELDSAESQAIC